MLQNKQEQINKNNYDELADITDLIKKLYESKQNDLAEKLELVRFRMKVARNQQSKV